MPKAGQGKDDGVVIVLLTEDYDEQEARALCDRLSRELGTVVMEWLKRPAAMRKTDRTGVAWRKK
jgi:uncharacterized NAD-dependent epimerase/dehydratase family protein